MKLLEIKKNLRSQKLAELKKALDLEYEKLARIRVNVHAKKEKNFNKIKESKQQIARILTIIGQKVENENDK